MAGQSQREIKQRIRSVKSMQHITRAMQLVSAAKLRHSQTLALASRPFANQVQAVLLRLARAQSASHHHPLLQKRTIRKVAYLVITSDRGLAGGYNLNVIRHAMQVMAEETHPYDLYVVGHKGYEFFQKSGYSIAGHYMGIHDEVEWHGSKVIANKLMDLYAQEKADAVYLVYSEFVNVVTHKPTVRQMLPLVLLESMGEEGRAEESAEEPEYIWEPSPEAILDHLLPKYVETLVYDALTESKASEHGARMAAMQNATDNAEEMIDDLTLIFNRARQAGITQEITEIVGGANAQLANMQP